MSFKWGIIGPGNIAKDFAQDLSMLKMEDHEVYAVLARDIETAEAFSSEQGAQHASRTSQPSSPRERSMPFILPPH